MSGDTHRRYLAMMAELFKSVSRQLLNVGVVRLGRGAVNVGVQTQVALAVERLWVFFRERTDLIFVDQHRAVLDPRGELVKRFGVVVLADARVHAIVPTVHPADKIAAFHAAIRHQCSPMKAATIENRHILIETDDDQIHLADKRVGWHLILELVEAGDLHFVWGCGHGDSLLGLA